MDPYIYILIYFLSKRDLGDTWNAYLPMFLDVVALKLYKNSDVTARKSVEPVMDT